MCSLWQLTSHPLTGSLLNVLVADVAALELRLEHVLVFPLAVALAVFVAFALALVVPGEIVLAASCDCLGKSSLLLALDLVAKVIVVLPSAWSQDSGRGRRISKAIPMVFPSETTKS